MPRSKRHVNVWQSPNNDQWYYQLIGANGTSADGPSKPYVNRSNARRAARRLFPEVPVITVHHREKNA
jgi:hypothetical protein